MWEIIHFGGEMMHILWEMILAPFGKQNCNLKEDMKFSTYVVDSKVNKLLASYNIFHNCHIHKSLNNICSPIGMLMLDVVVNNWGIVANVKALRV